MKWGVWNAETAKRHGADAGSGSGGGILDEDPLVSSVQALLEAANDKAHWMNKSDSEKLKASKVKAVPQITAEIKLTAAQIKMSGADKYVKDGKNVVSKATAKVTAGKIAAHRAKDTKQALQTVKFKRNAPGTGGGKF